MSELLHTQNTSLRISESTSRELHTPRSLDTSSDEVFGVAKRWLDKCRCFTQADTPNDQWYPKRLIDLEELRNANGLKEIDGLTILSEHGDIEHRRVHLVEFDEHRNPIDIRQGDAEESENFRYVTLSHCWGKPKSLQGQLKLTSKTENRFRTEGIELKELPKTFRDAMLFACRLDKVRYIWIDSLCIKQREKDIDGDMSGAAHTDWLEQSRTMDQIYRKSFLNISATAASDGDQGLFSSRKPDYLWEDEVNVNYSGTNMIGSYRGNSIEAQMVTRCTLIDVSFWDEIVEQAPVNRRGWVSHVSIRAGHDC